MFQNKKNVPLNKIENTQSAMGLECNVFYFPILYFVNEKRNPDLFNVLNFGSRGEINIVFYLQC